MSVKKIWKLKKSLPYGDDLLKYCGNNKILAAILALRGVDTSEKADKFLNPLNVKLSSPDCFSDMEKASERIKSAIDKNEHITIYGDFDADGVTSVSILYLTLKKIGADVDYYLPDRASESHGLNTKALVNIISKRKTKLLITVDCGISNVSEVKFSNGFKTDVIITDHHEAPEILPQAFAILNPKAQGALIDNLDAVETESFGYLSGAGVALKLAYKMLEIYNEEDFAYELLPVCAVGTIGDIVELKGENRTIVASGIELLKRGKCKGLQYLLKESSLSDVSQITSENIAFSVVPKINAAGRLESPLTALKIFISDDDDEIKESVKLLSDLNFLRQKLCEETFQSAKQKYEKEKNINKSGIILLDFDWHVGIVGIVCSKLVEEYNKPAFLMTRDDSNPDIIRCSCRSIQGLNIHDVLSSLKDYFEGFGGHKMAAGFSFDEKKITFEKMKSLILNAINEFSEGIVFSQSVVYADLELNPDDISLDTVKILEKLEPFGAQNPVPLFMIKDINVKSSRMMGKESEHLKIFAEKGGKCFDCVKWNCDNPGLPVDSKIDILFNLKSNTFNGVTSPQLLMSDIHSDFIKDEKTDFSLKILDHRKKKNILPQVTEFLSTTVKSTAVYVVNPVLKKNISEKIPAKISLFSDVLPENKQQLMFFEPPVSSDSFKSIVKSASPEILHIMNFGVDMISTDELLTKITGMLKYSLKNNDGKFDIKRLASASGINEYIVECILNLLNDEKVTDVSEIGENMYALTYINPVSLAKLKSNDLYSEINDLVKEINDFKEFWINSDLEQLKEILR